MKKHSLFLFSLLLIFAGCYSSTSIKEEAAVSKINLKANLEFLADDLLEGREAAERGEKLAALFLATELKKYGVKPYGDDGTYFQKIRLTKTNVDTSSSLEITNESGQAAKRLKYIDDFIRASRAVNFSSNNLEVVFAGYGITAPEFNYNDYENADVKNKIVFVLSGEPKSDDEKYFAGEKVTRYSYSRYKSSAAGSAGAAALIIINDDDSIDKWNEYVDYYNNPSTYLMGSENLTASFPSFRIKKNIAEEILNVPVDSLYAADSLIYFQADTKLNFNIYLSSIPQTAINVLGIIEGIDNNFKDEYVAVGAHYDHVGVRGGEIYNGADDDGSGTVAVLEAARVISQIKDNKRSIFIAFHTAEEKGLLGSKYLVENLDILPNIVAQINLDMIGREHEDSIYVIGSDKLSSEFHRLVNEVNDESVKMNFNYRFNSDDDPNRFYYRSDHYNYAKNGIPIVFFYDYMQEDYHKPSDKADKINFDKMTKMTELVYKIALRTANLSRRLTIDK